LHQAFVMGVDWIKSVYDVPLLGVGRAVPEGAQWIELADGTSRKLRLHVLWFVHDEDGPGGFEVVDRFQSVELITLLMNDACVLVPAHRLDCREHDLN